MTKAKEGIWTPWALILCYECHGPEFPRQSYDTSSIEWSQKVSPVDLVEGNAITTCDKCGSEVQLGDSEAVEHNVVVKLRELGINANMWQTGGMCSAVGINKAGHTKEQYESGEVGHYMITYNFDGDDKFWLGEYDEEGDWLEHGPGNYLTENFDELIKYIKDHVASHMDKLE